MESRMYCPPPGGTKKQKQNASIGAGYTLDKNRKSDAGTFLMGVLAGASIGAIAALLLAPDKGKHTRKNITGYVGGLGGNLEQIFENGRKKVEFLLAEIQHGKNGHKKTTGAASATGYETETYSPYSTEHTPNTAASMPPDASNDALGNRGVGGTNPTPDMP
ncbi:MAG: YtxH domain-containing protein [Hymenobacteraceae bacterium]|nr:YtxH domain-containing protein [Hymenobacteraceae bacterium]MDX5395454.1 YtxH domain-containing protein [Hymenobacteraceae bacterium]MDX5443077.1 YtxH domain-containing protein [Hymenobacteraceae bacterium]MDX5511503.1 YtxH domain-containing protein [Hymenobacteraceae bacterium]